MTIPEYTQPEHLGDPYLGAWYEDDVITVLDAALAISEVERSGMLEPIRDNPNAFTAQKFKRLVIDLRKEHDFHEVEALGKKLANYAMTKAGVLFPNLMKFRIDEAAVQVYPAGEDLPLGWHLDHEDDPYLVISATLTGEGVVSFADKKPRQVTDADIIANVRARALGAMFFRANGLYARQDGSDIRKAHAVTSVGENEDRFTIQYRMNANAAAFGNTHVNADRPWR